VTTLSELARLGSATVYEAAGRRGLVDAPWRQIVPGSRVAGPARTVRCGQGDNLMVHAAMASLERGDVLVLTMPEPEAVALVGDLLATQAKTHGAAAVLVDEANAVSDNPLVFADTGEVISGGNFHAEPVALVADALAVAIAEIGNISERRSALLVDPTFSQLPSFLATDPGLESGYMIAQVTAAALASENKILAHPASVDSIPTSAGQEDHVSMATHAARRLDDMLRNAANIVAVELLAAARGIAFRRPLRTSDALEEVLEAIAPGGGPTGDVYLSPEIERVAAMVRAGRFTPLVAQLFPTTSIS